jgi:hypothetical protein
MGEPIKVRAERMYDDESPLPRGGIGRIYNLGAIAPIELSQPQAVGLIGGGGLLLGSAFAKGPASTIMAVLGALGIGAVGVNILFSMLQQLPTMSAPPPQQLPPGTVAVAPGQPGVAPVQYALPVQYAAPPPPPPPPKPTRQQSYAQIATAAAPLATELIKGLVSLF